jgi:membrane protein implicated in regulation of membrane protease activity
MKSFVYTFLALHITAGSIAVITGLVALLSSKPVSSGVRSHRRAGKLFLVSMAIVISTAIVLTFVSFNPYFAGLTVTAGILVFSGCRVLKRKRPDTNVNHRARLIDWLVALVILGAGMFLTAIGLKGSTTENLTVVYSLGITAVIYAAYDLYRFIRPLGFPFSPNLWLYEHIVKINGGYFAALAAFAGNVLLFIPPPWRQLWVTPFGIALSVILVVYYRRKLNARKSEINNSNNSAKSLRPNLTR